MEKLINLEDLLKHSILDLYSAEEQIIEALPAMIDKATDTSLQSALQDHLDVTKRQKERLDKIKIVLMGKERDDEQCFFSKLFNGTNSVKCKGVEGLIKEAQSLMGEDMEPATMDAAIIGAAQKIEHYEIAGYGTATAYAEQLNMEFVAEQLVSILEEEYKADEALSLLAKDQINLESEMAGNVIHSTNDNESELDSFPSYNDPNIDEAVIKNKDYSIPGVDHLATSPIASVEHKREEL